MKNIRQFAAFNILNSLYTLLQSSWLQYMLPQRPPKDPTLSGISQVRGINSSRQPLSGLPSDCHPFRIYITQPAQSLLLYDFRTQTNRPQSSSIHSLYEFLIHFYRSHSWNFVRKFKHSRPRDLGSRRSSFLLSTPIFFFFFLGFETMGALFKFFSLFVEVRSGLLTPLPFLFEFLRILILSWSLIFLFFYVLQGAKFYQDNFSTHEECISSPPSKLSKKCIYKNHHRMTWYPVTPSSTASLFNYFEGFWRFSSEYCCMCSSFFLLSYFMSLFFYLRHILKRLKLHPRTGR